MQLEHVVIRAPTLKGAHPGLLLLNLPHNHLREVAQQVGALGVELARLRVDAAPATTVTLAPQLGLALQLGIAMCQGCTVSTPQEAIASSVSARYEQANAAWPEGRERAGERSQGAEPVALRCHQRRASIEPDARRPDDQRVITEPAADGLTVSTTSS